VAPRLLRSSAKTKQIRQFGIGFGGRLKQHHNIADTLHTLRAGLLAHFFGYYLTSVRVPDADFYLSQFVLCQSPVYLLQNALAKPVLGDGHDWFEPVCDSAKLFKFLITQWLLAIAHKKSG